MEGAHGEGEDDSADGPRGMASYAAESLDTNTDLQTIIDSKPFDLIPSATRDETARGPTHTAKMLPPGLDDARGKSLASTRPAERGPMHPSIGVGPTETEV